MVTFYSKIYMIKNTKSRNPMMLQKCFSLILWNFFKLTCYNVFRINQNIAT